MNDDDIIKTVDDWEKARRAEKEELRKLRSHFFWTAFKIIFFPFTLIYMGVRWTRRSEHNMMITLVTSAVILMIGCIVVGVMWPKTSDHLHTCIDAWDKESCMDLLHACPKERTNVTDSCIKGSCRCVDSSILGCSIYEHTCVDQCARNPRFDFEDALLATCISKIGSMACHNLFDHCGNLKGGPRS